MIYEDTIAALATPLGVGGVAIIRISGENAVNIGKNIFESISDADIEKNPRKMLYGHIVDENEIIDEVLVCYMKSPKSYTGEDVVEINCHGGYQSVERILNLVLRCGARLAEKGEFTKRAFLNGRIDLSKAQGVIDTINAKSLTSHKIAGSLLTGKLYDKINGASETIKNILAKITFAIDFPQEDTPKATNSEIVGYVDEVIPVLEKLLSTYHDGKILKDGINIVIVGRPNVGKSSLLNLLLEEDRAIVTDIAGTTRDVIKEQIYIRGIPINLTDTAGIRDTGDMIEKIGVEKSLKLMENSDVIILMLDSSDNLSDEDRKLLEKIKDKNAILLLNKSDKNMILNKYDMKRYIDEKNIIITSTKTGEGVDMLRDRILEIAMDNPVGMEENIMITSTHHKDMLQKAISSLEDGKNSILAGLELDTVQIDFYDAWDYLGQITGATATESLLDTMFEQFCIGK